MTAVSAPPTRIRATSRTAVAPPRELASGRDSAIDLVRALCVICVVLLHGIMVGVTITAEGPLFDNASVGTWWIVPLSWLMQVMPLFFVIGGFSGFVAYRRMRLCGGSAADFVAARMHRLLRPAVVAIGIVGALLGVLALTGVDPVLVQTAGFRYGQPLWFLGVFLLCQALLPLLAAAHDRAPLLSIGTLALAAVGVDALRAASGVDGLGFINLAFVWLALQQLGFFLADGRIDALSRRVRSGAAITAAAALVLACLFGVYSPDLIENVNPPTTALLLVGIVHTSLFSLHRERVRSVSEHPLAQRLTGFVTPRAMTIYLWHMPVLLAMAGATALYALTTSTPLSAPGSLAWWSERPLWLAAAVALAALVATLLSRFEAGPIPLATHSRTALAPAVVIGLCSVTLLLVMGTSVLTAGIALLGILLALRLSVTRTA